MRSRWFARSATWIPFAQSVGGEFVKRGIWGGGSVQFVHNKVDVKVSLDIDEGNSTCTAIRSPVHNIANPDRDMVILKKNWPMQKMINAMCTFAGLDIRPLEDLQINGYGSFLSSPPEVAEQLFRCPKVKNAISNHRRLSVAIGSERLFWRKGNLELVTRVPHFVKDEREFVNLVTLHTLLLDSLCDAMKAVVMAEVV